MNGLSFEEMHAAFGLDDEIESLRLLRLLVDMDIIVVPDWTTYESFPPTGRHLSAWINTVE